MKLTGFHNQFVLLTMVCTTTNLNHSSNTVAHPTMKMNQINQSINQSNESFSEWWNTHAVATSIVERFNGFSSSTNFKRECKNCFVLSRPAVVHNYCFMCEYKISICKFLFYIPIPFVSFVHGQRLTTNKRDRGQKHLTVKLAQFTLLTMLRDKTYQA